jgi:regulator of cell morphogenesis and NO signaling
MTDRRGIAPEIGWNCAALSELISQLVEEHNSRFRVELQVLQEPLKEVYVSYRQRDFARLAPLPGLLFLFGYELDRHMRREELTIFPAIEALEKSIESREEWISANRGVGALISATLSEHDDILDRLIEARRITGNYECPSYAGQDYRNLFHRLEALDHDLSLHIRIENDSVFPRALSLAQVCD